MEENQLAINKAFMAKSSVLKLQYNKKTNSVYMHAGKKTDSGYIWEKCKLSDIELGRILVFIENKEKQISFFHSFKEGDEKKIWFNFDDKGNLWVRIEEIRKQLDAAQTKVLSILLEQAIVACNAV